MNVQAEQFLLECQNGFKKGVSRINPLFSMNYL